MRMALIHENKDAANRAFGAIRVASEVLEVDGRVPTKVPEEIARGRAPDRGTHAGAAAFFLADACMGMQALEAHTNKDQFIPANERKSVAEALTRAIIWLEGERTILEAVGAKAPNRHLLDGLAFHACGTLSGNHHIRKQSRPFVDAALDLYRDDGTFNEGEGTDTSYQAVSIRLGYEFIMSGSEDDQLADRLTKASDWLAAQVDEQGRVDSSENARSCGGVESFLGAPKYFSVREGFFALLLSGVATHSQEKINSAGRLANWALILEVPKNSCYRADKQ